MTTEHYHDILSYLHRLIDGTPWQGHLYAVGAAAATR